jgi:hypothetical protein
MQPQQPSRAGRLLGVVGSFVFVAFSLYVFFHRQELIDRFVVMQNAPTASLIAQADKAGMSDEGKFLLYASVPKIQDRQDFKSSCKNLGEKSAVLGCYSAQRIYVFGIEDERLSGVQETTLAHEMLHAAYERLSSNEKKRVDGLIEAQYSKNTDARVADLVKVYDESEPGERDNELHSILATEVRSLSPELEEYYAQYFTDRQKVVTLFESYYAVFNEIQIQQQALVDELNNRARSINDHITTYNQDADSLSQDIEAFNSRASSYTSQTEFNRDRQALTARQQALKQAREEITDLISQYDAKKKELDAINLKAAELNQSINSNLESAPSL